MIVATVHVSSNSELLSHHVCGGRLDGGLCINHRTVKIEGWALVQGWVLGRDNIYELQYIWFLHQLYFLRELTSMQAVLSNCDIGHVLIDLLYSFSLE